MNVLESRDLAKLKNRDIVIFGSGSTCEEFLDLLFRREVHPRNIAILDSFKEGFIQSPFGSVKILKMTSSTPVSGILIIATCHWDNVLDIWEESLPNDFYLLSNELIHDANPIGQLESFYLSREFIMEKSNLKTAIINTFADSNSRDLFQLAFELRSGKSEKIFYEEILNRHIISEPVNAKYGFLSNLGNFDYVIDGGIYDGSEILELTELLSRNGEYHGFDPNLHNIKSEIYELAKGDKRIQLYNNALWDSVTTLTFDSKKGAASGLIFKEESNMHELELVNTSVLNEHFKDIEGKRCLIKLDIEGAELVALKGGVDFFKNNRMCFAISMYHRATDLFDIPEFLLDINNKFQFRIGITNPTFVDWVLFAYEQ
jgi:FkbM family methyltransferase